MKAYVRTFAMLPVICIVLSGMFSSLAVAQNLEKEAARALSRD